MKTNPRAFSRRLLFLAGFLPALAAAQDAAPENLSPYVVTATRTPEAVTTVGSAIDTLSADELARMQLPLLRNALSSIPGAPAFASGASGAVT